MSSKKIITFPFMFVVALVSIVVMATAYAASAVVVTNVVWTEVSPSPRFFLQNKCADTVNIKPSATQPAVGPGDTDDAFLVGSREVWVQNAPTLDTWWARSSGKDCTLVVEDL